jgi:hypothetical protein
MAFHIRDAKKLMPAELMGETDCSASQISGNKMKSLYKENERFANVSSSLLISL